MQGVDPRELRASGGFGSSRRIASHEASTAIEAARTLLRAQPARANALWRAGFGGDAPEQAGGPGVAFRERARDTIAAAALKFF